tara:strand:- start:23 stop:250 length:228 start_codon:yes stop_codon:yes gene_type:complete
MARFILDINSDGHYKMNENQINKICKKINEDFTEGNVFRIVCIDDSTDNQFYENEKRNKLNKNQIKNYDNFLKTL